MEKMEKFPSMKNSINYFMESLISEDPTKVLAKYLELGIFIPKQTKERKQGMNLPVVDLVESTENFKERNFDYKDSKDSKVELLDPTGTLGRSERIEFAREELIKMGANNPAIPGAVNPLPPRQEWVETSLYSMCFG